MFKNWNGSIKVNGSEIGSDFDFSTINGSVVIQLTPPTKNGNLPKAKLSNITFMEPDVEYKVSVRSYMTKKATPEFDLMARWNNDIPMPLMTMVGEIISETKGMVRLKLHGDILETVTNNCLCCGKPITNPISKFFGLGPVCGSHNYTSPFASDEELQDAISNYRKKLNQITWEGWVPKSGITNLEKI